jgi:hypothetical protein
VRDQTQDRALAMDDELDEVFGGANPNPERVGCPPREVLSALARKQRPIEDPAYLHLAQCSECYVEARALQRSTGAGARTLRSVARRVMAAAAIVLMIIGGTWLLGRIERRDTSPPRASVTSQAIELDLRRHAIERGDQSTPIEQPVLLPRRRVSITMLLPVGSQPGAYELELIGADGRSRTSATGTAILREFVTTLEIELDLSALSPGPYQLRIRHRDEGWRIFSATLQ